MPDVCTLTINPALDLQTSTDAVVPTDKLRCAAPDVYPGGGGINVARALHELGAEAIAVFPVGGYPGERIGELLARDGVRTRMVPIAGETRQNISIDERRSGQQFRFVLPGPHLSKAEQRACVDEVSAAAIGSKFVVASGSLSPGLSAAFYGEISRIAQQAGARFVLDSSAEVLRATKGAFLIKPCLRELVELAGRPLPTRASQIAAARETIARGVSEIVVVSLGATGALLITTDEVEFCPAIDVRVASAIGAGDSMLAGLLLGFLRGLSLRDCLRLGVAAAAAALLRTGTQLCRREDVERLHGTVAQRGRKPLLHENGDVDRIQPTSATAT